ncbi:MAG: AraC family transcriptional regulator [Shinella sp.]|nr:MAG: AraC family transcriptional regulator [Shinella sp.]
MERRSITAGFVEDILFYAEAAGVDPARILAETGVTRGHPVDNEAYGRLWLAIAEAAGDEFFALGARAMRPGSFTLMGHAVLSAKTLGQAVRRILRFLRVVLDDPWGELHLVHGVEAEIVLHDRRGARPAFADRTYWLLVMGLACWLVGRQIPLRRVDFAGPAPENRADYLQFFGAPVRFDAERSLLAFDVRYLALPNIRNVAQLQAFLRGAPANILLRYRHDQELTTRVRGQLRAMPAARWPDLEAMAGELGLSSATLRRRLRAEGQGFATIRDEVLRERAEQFLSETGDAITQIATELGYSEPGAFHRAFRKWTGQTPGAFRAAALTNRRAREPESAPS